MVSFRIIAQKRDKIKQQHFDLINSIDDTIEELLDQLDEEIVNDAHRRLTNQDSVVSGELLASVRVLSKDTINHVHEVGSDVPQAKHTEYGRGPVKATKKKSLHFVTKEGDEVFVKSVGPAKAKPFLGPAVVSKTKVFQDVLVQKNQEKINKILR